MSDLVLYLLVVLYAAGAFIAIVLLERWANRIGLAEQDAIPVIVTAAFAWPLTLAIIAYLALSKSLMVLVWCLFRPNTADPFGDRKPEKRDASTAETTGE